MTASGKGPRVRRPRAGPPRARRADEGRDDEDEKIRSGAGVRRGAGVDRDAGGGPRRRGPRRGASDVARQPGDAAPRRADVAGAGLGAAEVRLVSGSPAGIAVVSAFAARRPPFEGPRAGGGRAIVRWRGRRYTERVGLLGWSRPLASGLAATGTKTGPRTAMPSPDLGRAVPRADAGPVGWAEPGGSTNNAVSRGAALSSTAADLCTAR